MFRNKEIRRFAVIFLIITGAAAAAGFSVSRESGLLILITAAAFGTAFFIFTRIRYRKLAELADQIDLVLHDDDGICIAELDEGELSILQNEIAKRRRGSTNRTPRSDRKRSIWPIRWRISPISCAPRLPRRIWCCHC